MTPPLFVDYGDRIAFANDDGSHIVWKQVSYDDAGHVVGPGYIGRIIFRAADGTISGKRPCDAFIDPAVTVNDPSVQGIGIVGWHHYRAISGETDIWNKGWDFGGHKQAQADPFGVRDCIVAVAPYYDTSGNVRASFVVNFVDRYSAAAGKRVACVRYDYIVEPSDVKVWTTFIEFPDGFDAGPQPFLKEPKYAIGVGGSTYQPASLTVFDAANGTVAAVDLANDPRLQDPTHGTVQVPNGPRCRLAFMDGSNYFNVVARANGGIIYGADGKPTSYGVRAPWVGSVQGLDAFAVDANSRQHFDDSVCADYCLQGAAGTDGNPTLSRKWEIAKRKNDPRVEVMLHGWEGGSGLPACLCAARAFKAGKAWTNFFSVSRDAGWVI